MIKGINFQQYAIQEWNGNNFIKPISDISKSDNGNSPLVDRPEKIFCFDLICEDIYKKNKPASVDGLFFCKDTAYLIEFKKGFKKKITKENFHQENCPTYNTPCKDYAPLFFKNQKMETEALVSSLKFKAVESYLTLEKQILPCCQDSGNCRLVLFVVVDIDAVEEYESILYEASEGNASFQSKVNNDLNSISQSFQNYRRKQDKHSPCCDYFYDDIKVMSVKEFEQRFDELLGSNSGIIP